MTLRDLFYRWFIPQSEAITRMKDLPPLPEAGRMRTTPATRRAPRTIDEWKRAHERKRA